MRKIFNNNFVLGAVLVSAATLTGAACDTATNTNTNGNTATTTNATSSPSPVMSPSGNMSNMNNNMSGMGSMNMQSSPNAASQPYDLQFIDTMIAHHQSAIDMARPAETKSQRAELKAFARKIVEDQEREIAEMKRLREQWYAGKPQAMNMELPGMMDSMRGMDMNRMNAATGNEFDLMFIDMMTQHHTGATTMAREALMKAEHPEIKRIAQGIISAQEREIAQMKKWKQAWGGANANSASGGTSNNNAGHHDAPTGGKPGGANSPKH
ncbi:MAG: DUF305 domain-containing protein [Pyrinomonadaceae bacterium]|nr:DUF305 domain-containing protein [Pyrinomonadaceae bacterium]